MKKKKKKEEEPKEKKGNLTMTFIDEFYQR